MARLVWPPIAPILGPRLGLRFKRYRTGTRLVDAASGLVLYSIVAAHGGQIGIQTARQTGIMSWFTFPTTEATEDEDPSRG